MNAEGRRNRQCAGSRDEVDNMTGKARIAHLAGPNATIQNTPPLARRLPCTKRSSTLMLLTREVDRFS